MITNLENILSFGLKKNKNKVFLEETFGEEIIQAIYNIPYVFEINLNTMF